MNKRSILFFICLSVPSLFPAASEVTPEWIRDQQQLDELKELRQWYAARFQDAMAQLPEAQREGQAFRIRYTLDSLVVRIWQAFRNEQNVGLLNRYPAEREHWMQMYNTINRIRRGIPDVWTQRAQERAAQQ